MRHLYACPTRWGDLDMLGHVNNVTYVDYLQEARVDMLRTHPEVHGAEDLAEGVVVVRHEVTYVSPLYYRRRPVLIECWVSEIKAGSFTLAYEVFHEDDKAPTGRRVYLRATSVLAPYMFATESPRRLRDDERAALTRYLEAGERRPRPERFRVPHTELGHEPVYVRFSDVDVYRHVNNVQYVGYYQEARIGLFDRLHRDLEIEHPLTVIAQCDIDYLAPLLHREEPYDCWSRVSHVGDRSVTIDSEICDGDVLLSRCRVVIVFVDGETQRATEPPPEYRERLLAAAGG